MNAKRYVVETRKLGSKQWEELTYPCALTLAKSFGDDVEALEVARIVTRLADGRKLIVCKLAAIL